MFFLAINNLFQQKLKLFLSIAGVALSIGLIILLNGFLVGIYAQVTAYLDHTPADWIVAQDGVTNMLGASSIMPADVDSLVKSLPGVVKSIPIIAQYTILDIHDEKVVGYMLGYDEDLGGGPWEMAGGRMLEDDDEVVLDLIMAEKHGFSLGDTIEILDEDFTIVGFSKNTSSWMASFFFIRKEAAERLLQTPGATSFYLLSMRPEADARAVETRIKRRLDDYEVLPANVVQQNDLDLLVEIFAVPMQAMVTIAFAVGTAILGMIIYTATVSRAREYGVLKAVGAKNKDLYLLVVIQALFIALIGVGLGIGITFLAANWIMAIYPTFLVVIQLNSVLGIAASGLLMGLLAALIPVRYLSNLDPAEVFRR